MMSNNSPGRLRKQKLKNPFDEFEDMIKRKYKISKDMYDEMSFKERNIKLK